MKPTKLLSILVLLAVAISAQTKPAAQATATDIYHVHFNKAAIGKAAELGQSLSSAPGQSLSTPAGAASEARHMVVLRHQEGDDWDYCVIEHLGTKATVDNSAPPTPAAQRDLSSWHGDTFVSGPAWAEFAKQMGLDQTSEKNARPMYIVSVYRAAPGHRDQMEQMLRAAPNAKVPTGNVVLQHLEGAPWNFVSITRYNSWQDLATDRAAPANADAWNQTREHTAMHHDTIADRIAPK